MSDRPEDAEAFVRAAVNRGAELVNGWLDLGERDDDLVNLVVNAAVHLVEHPGDSMANVIEACYETDPDEVRGWWDW